MWNISGAASWETRSGQLCQEWTVQRKEGGEVSMEGRLYQLRFFFPPVMGKEGLKDPQSDSLLKDNSSVRMDAGIEG